MVSIIEKIHKIKLTYILYKFYLIWKKISMQEQSVKVGTANVKSFP